MRISRMKIVGQIVLRGIILNYNTHSDFETQNSIQNTPLTRILKNFTHFCKLKTTFFKKNCNN